MSLLSKKRYRYEMLNVQNMNVDAIKNADDLINFIIGENKGLQSQHEDGSATLVKYLNDKAIYAQNIKLPILQNEAYFENLLVNFYTKAAVPFDPSLLEEIQTEQFPRHEVLETYRDPVEPVQALKTAYNDDFEDYPQPLIFGRRMKRREMKKKKPQLFLPSLKLLVCSAVNRLNPNLDFVIIVGSCKKPLKRQLKFLSR